jgi:CheY-like chemotaxis protein
MVTLLSYVGHEVIESGNGVAGLEIVRAKHPALIVCVMLMPTIG